MHPLPLLAAALLAIAGGAVAPGHLILAGQTQGDEAPAACDQTVTLFLVRLVVEAAAPTDILTLQPTNAAYPPVDAATARLGEPGEIAFKASEKCARYEVSAGGVLAAAAYRVVVTDLGSA